MILAKPSETFEAVSQFDTEMTARWPNVTSATVPRIEEPE